MALFISSVIMWRDDVSSSLNGAASVFLYHDWLWTGGGRVHIWHVSEGGGGGGELTQRDYAEGRRSRSLFYPPDGDGRSQLLAVLAAVDSWLATSFQSPPCSFRRHERERKGVCECRPLSAPPRPSWSDSLRVLLNVYKPTSVCVSPLNPQSGSVRGLESRGAKRTRINISW